MAASKRVQRIHGHDDLQLLRPTANELHPVGVLIADVFQQPGV